MIGVVTVLFNSGPVLPDYFSSLDNQSYKDFKLYIIDNKSQDNSLEVANLLVKKVGFDCIVLPQNENWGVAKGNNIGIQAALQDGCDYILLSNNDTVLEFDCIENLLNGLVEINATMAVPKIYYYATEKKIWCAGGYFKVWRCRSPHRGCREEDHGQYDENCMIDYAPTCFMLIRSDVFKRVGLMDENYFVYYDDSDFVWRAVREGQEKLAYIFESVLWHKESYSTGGSMSDFYIRYYNRNKVYFARKHFNYPQRLLFYFYLVVQYIVRSRSLYNNRQRRIYKQSCIEGWHYYNKCYKS